MIFAEVLQAQGDRVCARRVLAFAADHPSVSAPDRKEIMDQLARLPAPEVPEPWPAIELDELVHRIISEAPLAHAPLIASLRGALVGFPLPVAPAAPRAGIAAWNARATPPGAKSAPHLKGRT